jgi:hypothetical protein
LPKPKPKPKAAPAPATPRYAVLFKIHFWDDFAARQFDRLRRVAGTDDVFVLVDETKTKVPDIPHDRVIRMTEQTAQDEGFLLHPKGNAFWYNTDYQLYHFIETFPDYAYIVTVEYDVVVNADIAAMVRRMAAGKLDFVGEPVKIEPARWAWRPLVTPYYPADLEITGRLVCFAAFSRAFALQLWAGRRDHARRYLAGEMNVPDAATPWPNNEGFIGAEIQRLGARAANLAEFGDVSCYNWTPPRPEDALPALPAGGFIHPLLDMPRFLQAIPKLRLNITDIFDEATDLGGIALSCPPEALLRALLTHVIRTADFGNIEPLRAYAARRGVDAKAVFNVARGKPATQSTLSAHSRGDSPAQDAAGAVNGRITGGYGFHTGVGAPPWWCVDLEKPCPVREIRVYNRLDVPERARTLIAAASNDMLGWTVIHEYKEETDFGGADGKPLVIKFPEPVMMRFLRLQTRVRDMLHLDEVEVFI